MNNEIKTWQERLEKHNSTNHVFKKKRGLLWDAPDAMLAEIAELRAKVESLAADAERFVFEHSRPDAMIHIEMAALSLPPGQHIDWYRGQIDAAIAKEKA